MSKRVAITKADLAANAHADWNAFIDLIATTDYSDLGFLQRRAHLVFLYESEVQNGGHLQFLTNCNADRAMKTVASLDALGASAHARVLEQALNRWNDFARLHPADALEYSAIALEMEFSDLDRSFHGCPVSLITTLQHHLSDYEREYIIREP